MNIVHLNTTDIRGGAARAAHRLHQGLQNLGMQSSMFVRSKTVSRESIRSFELSCNLTARIRRRWRHQRIQWDFTKYKDGRPNNLEAFSDDRTLFAGEVVNQCPSADILNLHWVANFVDVGAFFDQVEVPVVWTLHDMNAFTGGCHYNMGCYRYRSACGSCPQLGSEKENDLSHSVWQRKSEAYRSAIIAGQLNIVSPSRWLAEEARSSSLLAKTPVHVIPYGLDATTFCPRETGGLYRALEIPGQHRILLFVADSSDNHRKGFEVLHEAIESLTQDDVALISIGTGEPKIEANFPCIHLGSVQSDLLLSVFYSLADVFVIPSRQDNLPNTVLESMACGTPVVGFDTGGIPDMVRPGETGWLAETGNVRALRGAIEQALTDDAAREQMGRRCREVVKEEYTLEVQAKRYRQLYASLLSYHPSA